MTHTKTFLNIHSLSKLYLSWTISSELWGRPEAEGWRVKNMKTSKKRCDFWFFWVTNSTTTTSQDQWVFLTLVWTMERMWMHTSKGKWSGKQPSLDKTIAPNVKTPRVPLRNWHRTRPLNQRTPPPANLTALPFIHPQGEACRPEEVWLI